MQMWTGTAVFPFAFHKHLRRKIICDTKINLSFVCISEIPKFQRFTENITLVMHPFQQMGCNQVLKPCRHIRNQAPIKMVMLLFLFNGPDQWRPKRRKPEQHIDVFQNTYPAVNCFMGHLQILPQSIQGQGGTHKFRMAGLS